MEWRSALTKTPLFRHTRCISDVVEENCGFHAQKVGDAYVDMLLVYCKAKKAVGDYEKMD